MHLRIRYLCAHTFFKYDLELNTSNLISVAECETMLQSKFASTIISANES